VVVPNPVPDISSAEIDVVAVPATVVVEKYKLPPAFRNAHWPTPPPAERANWLAVADDGFNRYVGVVVPTPK